MKELITFGSEKKYSSVYLVELINEVRTQEKNSSVLLHKNMLAKIEDEFLEEIGQLKIQPSSYLAGNGKQEKCYELQYEYCLQLLMAESKTVRKNVIKKLKDLNDALQQFKVPKNFKEALLLAVEQQEIIENQQLLIEEQTPKAEFYDAVTDSKDAIDIGTAAKVLNLGFGRTTLFAKLRGNKFLMGNNRPYQDAIDKGYFRVIETRFNKPDGSVHINIKTLVFQKGLDAIRKSLSKK